MTTQSALAYAMPDAFLLLAQAVTTDGVHVAVVPVHRLAVDASYSELGVAVFAALDAYQLDVPHPRDWKAFSEPVLRAAKLKSWRALQLRARCCGIQRTASLLRILPTRNGGNRGDDKGFHDLDQAAIELPASASTEAVGVALASAFERCR